MLAEDDPTKQQMDIVDDQIDTLGRATLGLTLGCARCHDHKFDPLPQADYYRLQAFFAASQAVDLALVPAGARATREKARKAWTDKRDAIRKRLDEIEAPVRKRLTAERRRRFGKETLEALSVDASVRTPDQSRLATSAERMLVIVEADIRGALPENSQPADAWSAVCHVLLASNEFIFLR